MKEKIVMIENARGIHLRPSGVIAASLKGYSGRAWVVSPQGKATQITASPLSVMGLSLRRGDVVTLRVEGEGEEEKLRELGELFGKHYDFT
ncbi:MAG: HPr family phosphocarrier protein [Oligosphaeraceae bacterium]